MKNSKLLLLTFFLPVFLFGQANNSLNSHSKNDRVLFIVSSKFYQGNSKLTAGNSFSEIIIAYDEFKKAGFEIDFVSPKGGIIPLSYINTSNDLQLAYLYDCNFMYQIKHTLNPDQIIPSDYQIVHYVGGSSPIYDIPQNSKIQKIVMSIYEKYDGVISAVCHGTAGIVHLKTQDGKYLVAGKNVNGVPDSQESKNLPHYQHYPFIIQTLFEERGGNFRFSKIGTPHVEVDGRLVTGQNSLSSKMVATKSIEIIKNKKANQ